MIKRVAVTGMGIYSSAGKNLTSFKKAILTGKRCFSKIPHKELTEFGENVAALVKDYPNPDVLNGIPDAKIDPVTKLAAQSAIDAINDAGLDPENMGSDTGLIVSTCSGPMLSIEKFYTNDISRDLLPPLNYNSICNTLAEILNITGFTTTITTACSAGSAAIGLATDLIREGSAKRILVGGADTFAPTTFAGFFGLKAVSKNGTTPFSVDTGMSLGEAGAFILLEDMDIAEARGQRVISEIAGFGLSNDAYHCSAPDNSGKGQSYAMSRALEHSGISPDSITYINAHGTGTAANDRAETKAVKRVFSKIENEISMSSTKSMVGHCLGAAGVVEMIASLCCAEEDVYPMTAGFIEAREGCSINPVCSPTEKWKGHGAFLNNNFAFGGNNASLILSKSGKLNNLSKRDLNKKTIVITGVGVLSSLGIGCKNLSNKESLQNNYSIKDFDERKIDRRLDLKGMDRSSRFATVASKLALTESSFKERPANLRNLGLILGLSTGTTSAEEIHVEPLMNNGFTIDKVQNFPYVVPNSIQGNVSRALHLQGHNTVITSGKDSSHEVIRLGVSAIDSGHTDQILCGTVNEIFKSDPKHNGKQGEGAVVFMIESLEAAEKRDATPIAEIIGSDFFYNRGNLQSDFSKRIDDLLKYCGLTIEEINTLALTDPLGKIADIFKDKGMEAIDLQDLIGDTESCSSLMNISYFLSIDQFDIKGDKNYILSLSCDEDGANSILLIKTI